MCVALHTRCFTESQCVGDEVRLCKSSNLHRALLVSLSRQTLLQNKGILTGTHPTVTVSLFTNQVQRKQVNLKIDQVQRGVFRIMKILFLVWCTHKPLKPLLVVRLHMMVKAWPSLGVLVYGFAL